MSIMNGAPTDLATPGTRSLLILAAIANPHRMRILTILVWDGRKYAAELSTMLNIKRSLLEFHLGKLLQAGLIAKAEGTTCEGKARSYFSAVEFGPIVTPLVVEELLAGTQGWRSSVPATYDIATKLEHLIRVNIPSKELDLVQ